MSTVLPLATEAPGRAVTSPVSLGWWLVFIGVILALLLFDLLVVHRHAHVIGTREATKWSIFWIAIGVGFAGVILLLYPAGATAAGDYLTGYLIEKSLSVDNLFVFVLIFSYFGVPDRYQHRVLFWGIFGALIFRGLFIALGAALLGRFSWIAYVFGAILLYTGYKMATSDEIEVHPDENPILRLFKRAFPVTGELHGQQLFVRQGGALMATPLLAVLVVIETTDVVFAVDSIPAIFGITRDPFLVFTSNAFALLGLRALYFLLASAVRRFTYLSQGIALVLVLVGAKLIGEEILHTVGAEFEIASWVPLVGVALIIGGSIWLSLRHPPEDVGEPEAVHGETLPDVGDDDAHDTARTRE